MMDRRSVYTNRRVWCFLLLVGAISCIGAHALGVNYGTVANNLPAPADVVALVQSTYIQKVKLYAADSTIVTAFANTGIEVIVGVTNDEIPPLAASSSLAQQWVTDNVASYYPSTNVIVISVGNEVLTSSPNMSTYLVPAIQNLHTGLTNLGLQDKIKVSTPHSFGVLANSFPPSDGAFRTDLSGTVFVPLLAFLSQTGAPFMINAYPYFAYRDNPKLSISYALFEPNSGITDSTTGLVYNNLFDAQVDATYAAMAKLGHQDVKVSVSETGWPSFGDSNEVGVSISNAQTYNANLLKHVMANVGTPGRPGVPIDTYIFSLFNENLKPGPTSERNFGLFLPDRETVYNVGLMIGSSPPSVATPPSSPPPTMEAPPPWSPPTTSESPPPLSPPAMESPPPPLSIPPPPPYFTPSPESAPPAPVMSGPPPPPATAPPPPYPVPHSPPTGPTPENPPPSAGTPPYFPSPSPPPLSTPAPEMSPPSTPVPEMSPPSTPVPEMSPPSTPVPEMSPPSTPAPEMSPPSIPAPEMSPPSFPPAVESPPSTPPVESPPSPAAAPPPPSFFNPPPAGYSPPPATSLAPPPPETWSPPPTPVQPPPGTPPAPPGTPSGPNTWCVAKPGALLEDLVNAINYACGEGGADCTAIQSGQSCYTPNTLFSHCSYAFNAYYAKNGRNYWNCFFGNSSLITITNPSYSGCEYL